MYGERGGLQRGSSGSRLEDETLSWRKVVSGVKEGRCGGRKRKKGKEAAATGTDDRGSGGKIVTDRVIEVEASVAYRGRSGPLVKELLRFRPS